MTVKHEIWIARSTRDDMCRWICVCGESGARMVSEDAAQFSGQRHIQLQGGTPT